MVKPCRARYGLSQEGESMTQPARHTTRRRGAVLEQAIYTAVLSELAEVGYAELALDRVARRAQVGRASLYRRWSSKRTLVVSALSRVLPPLEQTPDTG